MVNVGNTYFKIVKRSTLSSEFMGFVGFRTNSDYSHKYY